MHISTAVGQITSPPEVSEPLDGGGDQSLCFPPPLPAAAVVPMQMEEAGWLTEGAGIYQNIETAAYQNNHCVLLLPDICSQGSYLFINFYVALNGVSTVACCADGI